MKIASSVQGVAAPMPQQGPQHVNSPAQKRQLSSDSYAIGNAQVVKRPRPQSA